MNPDQVGWIMGMSFILIIVLITVTVLLVEEGKLLVRNPLAPFIRAFESRQRHRQQLAKMKLRAQLIRNGMDPDYVAFMQKEVEK